MKRGDCVKAGDGDGAQTAISGPERHTETHVETHINTHTNTHINTHRQTAKETHITRNTTTHTNRDMTRTKTMIHIRICTHSHAKTLHTAMMTDVKH